MGTRLPAIMGGRVVLRTRWMGIAGLALVVIAFWSDANAQARRPSGREEELRSIPDRIAGEPDSIRRLVNMEGIVREGDVLKTQFAIKSALGVDDPELRGLALRAFLASQRNMTIEINEEGDKQKSGENPPPILRIELQSFDLNTGRGKLYSSGWTLDLDITGDSLRFPTPSGLIMPSDCEVSVTPAANFRLKGTATCKNRRRFDLSIRMY